MFDSGSLIEFLNIYLVENLTQSIVAASIVLPLMVWLVRPAAARIRYLLVPLILPVVSPPLYYLAVPGRQELWVIPLDRLLGLKQGLSFVMQWPAFTTVFGMALIVAAIYFLARGAVAVAAASYLPRRYSGLPPGQQKRVNVILAPLLARTGLRGPVILESPSPHLSCCAFGLRRPYLLVSRGLLESLDDEHLEGVVAHELAHFLRRDQFLNLGLLALRSFFFFNPFVHLLCRGISHEQELACDALAIRLGQRPITYAESLVLVWRQAFRSPDTWERATFGFFTQPALVRRRVTAVLEMNSPEGSERRPLLFAVTAFLTFVLFFVC
ncbi:MAG TPA: M56 family metallopeptidase [Dehalococcoidia bacterium]|nr:M56 family metallopeptidase [Dehalococcoidia bacterium]